MAELDFGSLVKGQTLRADALEKILGISRDHAGYGVAQADLQTKIHRLRPDLVVRKKGKDLEILLDAQVPENLERNRKCCARAMGAITRKASSVDRSELDQAQLRSLEATESRVSVSLVAMARDSKRSRIWKELGELNGNSKGKTNGN